ncbi:hypothetical protein BDV26DRAFT_31830 [Aspergillus bertholletiae]|uniref:Uncharacterized protein n=1 Tax=Aspergillus bertholletiae TaxID=1226010 RepID=A0A5N7AYG5_9EURO|nr:hypothetical protein BDV26DRAFT_31830 [Aspergillus bertholletiae]
MHDIGAVCYSTWNSDQHCGWPRKRTRSFGLVASERARKWDRQDSKTRQSRTTNGRGEAVDGHRLVLAHNLDFPFNVPWIRIITCQFHISCLRSIVLIPVGSIFLDPR